jgi:hypothetical protein
MSSDSGLGSEMSLVKERPKGLSWGTEMNLGTTRQMGSGWGTEMNLVIERPKGSGWGTEMNLVIERPKGLNWGIRMKTGSGWVTVTSLGLTKAKQMVIPTKTLFLES